MSGLDELSDSRISSIAHKLNIPDFGGCWSKDELSSKPSGKFYVINMQNHTGSGTHWVLLDARKPHMVYFDSFGVAPPKQIMDFCKQHGTGVTYNTVDLQSFHSDACGWYCLYMMLMMQKRSMHDITHNDFVNLRTMKPRKNNDQVLARCFQSFIHRHSS